MVFRSHLKHFDAKFPLILTEIWHLDPSQMFEDFIFTIHTADNLQMFCIRAF